MRRNLALSILFVALTAAGIAQTDSSASANHPPANQPPASQATIAPQPAVKTDQAKTPEAATPVKTANARQGQAANSAQTGEHAASNSSSDLNAVLAKMNQSASGFKTAQGDFEFETYQKLMDEKEQQQGRIYFRRTKNGVDAAFEIEGKAPKQVVYKDGMIRIYQPKINQISERDVSKNKSSVEAFLSLGFGARGDDLLRDYDVKMAGWETVGGVKTAKLELLPKNQKMRQTYDKIVLWVDPERDVLLQQQFFEPSKDYRLARYSNMKLNEKLSDDAFRLKTTGKPTVVPLQ